MSLSFQIWGGQSVTNEENCLHAGDLQREENHEKGLRHSQPFRLQAEGQERAYRRVQGDLTPKARWGSSPIICKPKHGNVSGAAALPCHGASLVSGGRGGRWTAQLPDRRQMAGSRLLGHVHRSLPAAPQGLATSSKQRPHCTRPSRAARSGTLLHRPQPQPLPVNAKGAHSRDLHPVPPVSLSLSLTV